jgi:MPBQ/MSBQ methyltransferase
LHAGHYGDPVVKKDFRAAKVDLIDEIIKWGVTLPGSAIAGRLESTGQVPAADVVKILDVGCGIGGSSRHLAKRWPTTVHVIGVTISDAQLERATLLAQAQRIDNVTFLRCDADHMTFPDASFDIVWAMEMEMYMPDKEHFVREVVRVLKPGGLFIIIGWNVRDTRDAPLSKREAAHLRLLVDEWCHANFTSIRDYVDILSRNGFDAVVAADWTTATLPSWRGAVWAGFRDPRGLMSLNVRQLWGATRDAYTILRFGAGFRSGLCQYGLIRGEKRNDAAGEAVAARRRSGVAA